MSSSAQETSSVQDDGNSTEEFDNSGKDDGGEHTIEIYKQNMVGFDDENLDRTEKSPVHHDVPEKKRTTIVASHKKSKKVRSK